jgi:hypothetical protein
MYRIVSGDEVRPAKSDKEEYEIERLGNIVHEYFPELSEKYFCIPEPYTQGGYIFNFFIDKESGMPVAIGCDDLEYNQEYKKIEPVPNTLTGSPVFNENEIIEQCMYLRKRYHEILKELKITDIKNCGDEYDA